MGKNRKNKQKRASNVAVMHRDDGPKDTVVNKKNDNIVINTDKKEVTNENGTEYEINYTENHNKWEHRGYKLALFAFYCYWIYFFVDQTFLVKSMGAEGRGATYSLYFNHRFGIIMEAVDVMYLMEKQMIGEIYLYQLVFIISSVIMQYCNIKGRHKLQALLTIGFVLTVTGLKYTLTIYSVLFIAYTLAYVLRPNKIGLWIFALGCLIVNNSTELLYSYMMDDPEGKPLSKVSCGFYGYMIVTNVVMMMVSFCSELSDNYDKTKGLNYSPVDMVVYVMNTSRFFVAPMHNYDKFMQSVNKPPRINGFRMSLIVRKIFDQLGIFLLIELMHACMFVSSFMKDQGFLMQLDTVQLYGLVTLKFHSFMLGQSIHFGCGHIMAAINGIETESRPYFIFGVYNGLSLWRTFDRGTNLFLQKYVFTNISRLGNNSVWVNMVARMLCFAFMVFSHGIRWNVALWSFAGFFSIFLEFLFKTWFMKTSTAIRIYDNMSVQWRRRIKCILYIFASYPLIIIGQVLFLVGHESAILVVEKTTSTFTDMIWVSLMTYIIIQVAIPLTHKMKFEDKTKKLN